MENTQKKLLQAIFINVDFTKLSLKIKPVYVGY